MKDKIKKLLEENVRARERRFHNEEIVKYLCGRYEAEYPHLRGSDYKTKDMVEQRKELSLGYEPNYQNDVRQDKLY